MHGRPRKAPKPEDAEASAAKAASLRSLQSQLLHYHHNFDYSKDALDVSAKLLEINPEWYTAWNFRKLAVEYYLTQSQSDPDSIKPILDHELRVVESALRQNFKSYGAWHHRKWVLNKGHSSIDRELKLLDQLQKADPRNFHAWNYRRFVAAFKGIPDEDELSFTTDMINNNFSNYSAWHNRSVLLSYLLKKHIQNFSLKEKVLTEELELVHQALFTDPDDQSGWFYHLWLLDQTVKPEIPQLVSAWPIQGSDIIVSVNKSLNCDAVSPFARFYSRTGMLPLVLYFDQAVEGVNSSTVTIESSFDTNKDLSWRPLTTLGSGTSRAWMTQLNLPSQLSKSFPVKISVGHSPGIISSSGCHHSRPSQFTFAVCVQPAESNNAKDWASEVILWRDDEFQSYSEQCQDPSLEISFKQLKIDEDHESTSFKWRIDTVAKETNLFRELLAEIICKIGKLSLARLLMAHDVIMPLDRTISYKEDQLEEVLKLLKDLMQLDPSHLQFYKDEHSLVLLRQLTSSSQSLLRFCYEYRDSATSSTVSCICLRLNNLSLTRIGSVEQLLWVQVLDLSHNELRSIEGLEAMQLLTCLNISYNKITSLMALGPLKLLKSLEVLNISHNEIGAHSIDTARYLCSSPLSHALGSESLFDKYDISGFEVPNYWEAFLIFKGLNLSQVNVAGNGISNEYFNRFMVKLLPKLKWLDGKQLD